MLYCGDRGVRNEKYRAWFFGKGVKQAEERKQQQTLIEIQNIFRVSFVKPLIDYILIGITSFAMFLWISFGYFDQQWVMSSSASSCFPHPAQFMFTR